MRDRTALTDGFSLLEVMIAMAVIAIALITLLGLSNRTVLVQERVQKLTRATLLAQQLLNEQEAGITRSSTMGELAGVFEEPYADFQWEISFEETLIPQVRQITVAVIWGRKEHNEQVEVISFVAAGAAR